MDKIKQVVLNYVSGRQITLGKSEALAALSREEWVEGKPNLVLIFERKDPFLKLYRNGEGYVFEMKDGIHEFENTESIQTNKYFETLLSNIMKELKEE